MLSRLTTFCIRRRRTVFLVWLVAIVGFTVAGSAIGGEHASGARMPGTDSDAAYSQYAANFANDPGGSARMVFEYDRGLTQASADIDAFSQRCATFPASRR